MKRIKFFAILKESSTKLHQKSLQSLALRSKTFLVLSPMMKIFAEAISLVFAKAVSEPNFSKLYAELCVKLSSLHLKVPDEKLAFRRALLNRCQEEFERTSRKLEDLPEDPEERLLVKEKERKNKLGNIKFIGELFKFKLLSEKIIQSCITILLNAIYRFKDDKESMEMNSELLCKLISTIGKLVDSPQGKQYMDNFFIHVTKFAQDVSLTARTRFMYQNLEELRSNNWTPRREENAPKKISEVHADALQKAYEEEYSLSQGPQEPQKPTTSAPTTETKEKPKEKEDASKKKSKGKKKKKKPTDSKKSTSDGQLSDDDLEQQLSSILKDYLDLGDLKQTEVAIKEIGVPNALPKLVEVGITISLERNDHDREQTTKLFTTLFNDNILTQEHLVKGFKSILESLKDLEVDIPFASKLVGKIIGEIVLSGILAVTWFDGIDEKVKTSMNDVIKRASTNKK